MGSAVRSLAHGGAATQTAWGDRYELVVDEPYVKVQGRWCHLYRAIDRDGNLVDCRLSETRDSEAAHAFFIEAREVTETTPERVTRDGHDSYPGVVRNELGEKILHRTNRYLTNLVEQDHRDIKQRYRPLRSLGLFFRPRISVALMAS